MKPVLALLLISTAALADDAALQRCRGIADASARLACYDALPLAGAETKSELAKPGTPPAAVAETKSEPAKPGALPPQKAEEFGLPRQPTEVELDKIESSIPGHFEGWQPNSRIRLANGQVWQVTDGSSQILDLTDPKVTIRRGVFSAFYLEFEGNNRTARVRRVQ